MPPPKDNFIYNPVICVTHVFLAGSAGWALSKTYCCQTPYAYAAFSFLFGHSIVGIFYFGSKKEIQNFNMAAIYEVTSIVAEILPIPMLATEINLLSGIEKPFAFIPIMSTYVPFFIYFCTRRRIDKILDLILIGNLISLIYISYENEATAWTWALIALTSQNHFTFRQLSNLHTVRFEEPNREITAIGLSFFCIFAANCLREALTS